MKILMTWTGNKDIRRSWEWRLGEYLEERGHEVLFAQDQISSAFTPDFVIATDFFTVTLADGWSQHFKVPFAVQCIGALPPPETDNGFWGKVRESVDRASVIVAVSESAKNHMLLTYTPKPPVVVNYQGVDDRRAEKHKPKRYNSKGPFIWIGSIEHRKRPELAIKVFTDFGKDLVMVGNPVGYDGTDWRKWATEHIDIVGAVDDDEKFELLSKSCALVATTYGEEFFIPAAEAGYYGLPLVLPARSDVEGHWVEVFHELWGDLPYYFEDAYSLKERILYINEHRREARSRGKRIRQVIDKKGLTMSGHAERWEKILQQYSTPVSPAPVPVPVSPVSLAPARVDSVEWMNASGLVSPESFAIARDIYDIESRIGLSHTGPQPRSVQWSRRFEYPWAVLNMDLKPSDRVLDAGGGDGTLQFYLAEHCSYVENFDYDENLLEWTRQAASTLGIEIGTGKGSLEETLPYPDGSFDKVICVSVLEHVNGEHTSHLRELLRVVKPGGRLVLTMDVVDRPPHPPGIMNITSREADQICNFLGAELPDEPVDLWYSGLHRDGRELEEEHGIGRIRVLCIAITKTGGTLGPAGLRLNIGSFTVCHEKPWINLDILDISDYAEKEGYIFQQVDVREGIPFDDDSVEYINASHLVEHLTVDEGKGFLVQCRRILKTGGVIRLAVPDGRKMAQAYIEGRMDSLSEGQPEEFRDALSEAEKFWLLATSGHKTMHDFTSLQRILAMAGYVEIEQKEHGVSKNPAVQGELRDMYPDVSIYVEAAKPDTEPVTVQLGEFKATIRPYRMDESIVREIWERKPYSNHLPTTGKVAIMDIGAHIGIFSLLAARNPEAEIYAYEPEPTNFELLSKNIQDNNLQDRVHIFNLGIAEKKGKRKLFLDPGTNTGGHSTVQNPVGSSEHVMINCITLREALRGLKRCDFLKMDVEGAELEIILNTSPAVLKRIMAMTIEFHPGFDWRKISECLESNGFTREYVVGDEGQGEQGGSIQTFYRAVKGPLPRYKQYLLGKIPDGRQPYDAT